jgi:hypothetical protein
MHSTLFQRLIIHGHSRKWTTGSATWSYASSTWVKGIPIKEIIILAREPRSLTMAHLISSLLTHPQYQLI